jgi:acyl-CoA thioesterase
MQFLPQISCYHNLSWVQCRSIPAVTVDREFHFAAPTRICQYLLCGPSVVAPDLCLGGALFESVGQVA